jgi:two-component system, cell cycle sensor histidine kinase and response regulator CckA
MDGEEVLREIRKEAGFTETVVVLMSSLRTDSADQARGLEAGADGYVSRPLDHQELVARVQTHLRSQKLARELKASERRYRELLAALPDGVLVVDSGGTIRYANTTAEELFDRSREELTGQPFEFPLGAAGRAELDLPTPEGLRRVLEIRSVETKWEGSPAWLAILRDDTERRTAEATLREQATLLDQAQDAIWVQDLEGTILFWNAGAERLYGWTREEAVGRSALELVFPDAPEPPDPFLRIESEESWHGELQHERKDGKSVAVEARWSLVRDQGGLPSRVLCVNTDVSERNQLLAQFLRAQRLESVGTLAGGIAHDLNNVLAPILMSIELLKDDIQDPEAMETLQIIEDSARSGAEMVKQVLGFARGLEGARTAVSLQRILGDLGRVVRDTFPRNISFHLELPRDLHPVSGDPTQIHQVFMNLFVNARDAMPTGGELRVTAENVELDRHYATLAGRPNIGHHVRISVRDTGVGMTPQVREKIFDPFFTTKGVGKGTGLGLSTVTAILQSHQGFLEVESQHGRGTTFHLFFPAEVSQASNEPAPKSRELPRGHGELILVVDDEASVRTITQHTLENFGYQVLTASDGAEAAAIYGGAREKIDLVLTDIMMPIMDGRALIRALRRIDPHVRIVAASGLAPDPGEDHETRVRILLPKPFTAEILLRGVEEALQDSGGSR